MFVNVLVYKYKSRNTTGQGFPRRWQIEHIIFAD